MHLDLDGAAVLVSGAGGRLARTLVPLLLDHGARVVGVDAPGAEHPFGERIAFHTADLTDERAAETLFAALGEPLDAAIHTVGTWDGRPLAETPLDAWRSVMDVNLTSAFLLFREGVRHFRRHGRAGRLVALASRQGTEGGVAGQAAYSAAKAGVVRLVEAAAREHAEHGIAAAAVAPSMILYGDEPSGTAGVPAARVAALCAYLASPAGAHHTGTVVRAFGAAG